MKKKFAGVLAVLMVLVMGTTTAFAAESSNAAEEYRKLQEKVADLNKKMESVTVKVGNSTVDVKIADVDAKQYLGAEGSKRNTESDKIVAMKDITGVSGKGPITVTLEVEDIPSLLQGQGLYVMHKPDDGEWEYYDVKMSDGKITVTMDSFSPVYVVVGDAPTNNSSNSSNNNGSSGGSYPVYYPVYYPSSGSNSNGSNSNGSNSNGNGSTTQPGSSNTPSDGNSSGSGNNGSYDDGYSSGYGDGYEAGRDDAKEEFGNNSGSDNSNGDNSGSDNSNGDNSGSGANASGGTNSSTVQPSSGGVVTAPKTGASLPALPFVAVFAAAGIALCGKKARKSDE